MAGAKKINELQSRILSLSDVFPSSNNVNGLAGKATLQALKDLFGNGSDPIIQYTDITALLANTDIPVNYFAKVNDASDEGYTGWALYHYTGGDRTLISSYSLIVTQDIYDRITSAITASNTVFMLSSVNSDIATYESAPLLSLYSAASLATISKTSVGTTPVEVGKFITDLGYPNILKIPIGIGTVHFKVQRTSGTQPYYLYIELYKRNIAGTETLLFTSENSSTIDDNLLNTVEVDIAFTPITYLVSTDRLLIRPMVRTTSGTINVDFFYDDNTESRFEIPSPPFDASLYLPLSVTTDKQVIVTGSLEFKHDNGGTGLCYIVIDPLDVGGLGDGIYFLEDRPIKKGFLLRGFGETDEDDINGNYDDLKPTSLMPVQAARNEFRPKIVEQDTYFETTRTGYTDFYEEVFEDVTNESWWEQKYVDDTGSSLTEEAGDNTDSTKGRSRKTLDEDKARIQHNPNAALTATKYIEANKLGVKVGGKSHYDVTGADMGYIGVATLVAGTITVNTNQILTASKVRLTVQTLGTVTVPKAVCIANIVNGTSFDIVSADVTDTSVVLWEIIEIA